LNEKPRRAGARLGQTCQNAHDHLEQWLMFSWFLQQANVDNAILERREQIVFASQEPRFLYFGLPIVAILGIVIFILQRRHFRSSSFVLVVALTACRVFIVAMLVVVLAGPFVSLVIKEEKRPIVVVMFDSSQSMGLRSGEFPDDDEIRKLAIAAGYPVADGALPAHLRNEFNEKSRAKLAQAIAQKQKDALFAPLFAKYDVRFYTFAREANPFGIDSKNFQLPETSPEGTVTHLGDSVVQVIGLGEGRPIAAVIVFSDGESTGGLTLEEAAKVCEKGRVPIMAIPVGTAKTQKDVSIVDVSTSGQVTVGDHSRIAVLIESHGYDGKPITVELFDGIKRLKTEDLVLRGAEQQTVELTFMATDPGQRVLSVSIKPFDDEAHQENNRDWTLLRVAEEKIKVLYIEGPPRWDFRFLKNAMRRDQGLAGRNGNQVDVILENEWRRLPEADGAKTLPQTLDELAAYHTIVLGDVSPKLLTPEFIKLLERAVREKGVGLLIEAGPLAMPHAYHGPLLGLLPVVLAKEEKRKDEPRTFGLFAPPVRPFKLELSPDGSLADAMRLYDDPGRNQSAWAQMPPYQWCVNAERPTASATVLMWNSTVQTSFGKLPLIAHHQVERGRVMLVGLDSTWLWRQNAADRFFYKFWGQAIRFVARPDDTRKRKTSLEVSPIPPRPKEPTRIVVNAFTDAGTPIVQDKLDVEITGPGLQKTLSLAPEASEKGRYVAHYEFPAVGDFRVAYGAVETNFGVKRSPEELRHPNVNRAKLRLLATATGGKLVEMTDPDWTKTILDRVNQSNLATTENITPKSATIWDNWMTLVLLVGVYCVDILLRRLTGLS
jgi:hypothetical protein